MAQWKHSNKINPLYLNLFFNIQGNLRRGEGGGDTPYNGLYGETLPERGVFFRPQVYERVGISLVEVYERVGKSVISARKMT